MMPTAAITGDVHHALGHHYLEKKEHIFSKEYSEVISKNNSKATLFVTGKCIKNNPQHWKKIADKKNIELGGHTYYAFQPSSIFYAYKDLFSRFGWTYGPMMYQLIDISKTVKAFKKANIKLTSWRSHAYRGDKTTGKLLPDFGIKTISELRSVPSRKLNNLPITCYPDDHIFLSTLNDTEYDPDAEMKKVKQSIYKKINNKEHMVIQLHPSSMKVYDEFESLNEIITKLKDNDYEFKTISEMSEEIKNLPESSDALRYLEE